MKFGVGQALVRKEDDPLIRGAGRYVADHRARKGICMRVVVRSPHAHARFKIADIDKARSMPGVRTLLTGDDIAALGNLPCVVGVPGQDDGRAALSGAGARRGASCRRRRRVRGCRHARCRRATPPRRSRSNGSRCRMWSAAEAALAPGAPLVWPDRPRQCRFRSHVRRPRQERRSLRQGRARGVAEDRQSAAGHQLSRYPRRGRRIRCGARPLHADARQPGQPRHPRRHLRHPEDLAPTRCA